MRYDALGNCGVNAMDAVLATVTVAYWRGRLFVLSKYSAGPGTYVECPPVVELSASHAESIGLAIRKAFDAFLVRDGMPDWATYVRPLASVIGPGNLDDFDDNARVCAVYLDAEGIRVRSEESWVELPLDITNSQLSNAVARSVRLNDPPN
jgi:hypothetical protein